MAGFYGADVAQLRALAAEFSRAADQLDRGRLQVGDGIRISAWVGPFAQTFRLRWESEHSRRLAGAAHRLRDSASRLRANADEQERASAVNGGGTGRSTSGSLAAGMATSTAGKPGGPGLFRLLEGADATAGGLDGGAGFVSRILQRFSPRWPNGTFRSPGEMSWLQKMWAAGSDKNWVAKPGSAHSVSQWTKVGGVLQKVGVGLSFAIGAWKQWDADAKDPTLSTPLRASRATVVGGTSALGGVAAAAVGAKIGAAIGIAGGPVGVAAGALIGGVAGGLIGSGVGQAVGQLVVNQVVPAAAKAVVSTVTTVAKAADSARKAVGGFLSSINPFR